MLMGIKDRNLPDPYQEVIENQVAKLTDYPDLQGGYCLVENIDLIPGKGYFLVNGMEFKAGKQVLQYLKHSEILAFFICTAGESISIHSKELMKNGEWMEGYVADLLGSLMVEEAMEIVYDQIKLEMQKSGMNVTNRYSPGYCEWDVEEQKKLFSLFPADFCGVSLGKSCLMYPVKSVSGVIGIGKDVKYHKYVCHACSNVGCIYRDLKYKVSTQKHIRWKAKIRK